jgi:hypothetical protein
MENGFEWPGLLSALVLAQYADQHDPERPVLLAVDRELGKGAGLGFAGVLGCRFRHETLLSDFAGQADSVGNSSIGMRLCVKSRTYPGFSSSTVKSKNSWYHSPLPTWTV